MPGGRPIEYCQEDVDKANDYLKRWKQLGDKVPMVAGLAIHMGRSRSTVLLWAKDEEKPEFSAIVMKIQAAQERELANNGLSGDFNPSITKLMMGKHGYKENRHTEHTGADGGPIEGIWTVTIVDPKKQEGDHEE